jgi:GNAT superfamily N-acetyltransferase
MSITPEPPDSPLAAALLERYFDELASRFPGGFDPTHTAAPTAELAPPHGLFLVAWLDRRAIGCGAVRRLDADAAEIKHMWVDPTARRLGVGRALLAELELGAGELGCRIVRLDTAEYLVEARAMYEGRGYREIAAYNDSPYADHWFEKPLR